MLLSRLATVVLLAFLTPLAFHIPSRLSSQKNVERSAERITPQDSPPANCRVTLPSDGVYEPPSPEFGPSRTPSQFYFGTDKLWTVLPADGTWRGPYPGGARDFVYSDKLPWYRTRAASSPKGVPLTIKGKRLDGPAPFFVETNEDFEYNPGGIVGGISIPAYGCWQITGHYDDQDVTFTVWVTRSSEQEQSSPSSPSLISAEPPPRLAVPPRIHVDPETQAKEVVYRVLPEIPPAAQAANASGVVVLHAVIRTDGRADELSYVSGPRVLAQAAIEAVRWWRYRINVASLEPFESREVDTTISVLFPQP